MPENLKPIMIMTAIALFIPFVLVVAVFGAAVCLAAAVHVWLLRCSRLVREYINLCMEVLK